MWTRERNKKEKKLRGAKNIKRKDKKEFVIKLNERISHEKIIILCGERKRT